MSIGVGDMNENIKYFTDHCAFNNMADGGNVIPLKRFYQIWFSPYHYTANQIDNT